MNPNTSTTLAYHFVGATLRDGSPVPPDGVWLRSPVQPRICKAGLHASRDPFDALQYAPGDTLCLVEVREVVTEEQDKIVAWERKIVKRIDATELLQYFARMRAVSVLQYWTTEPPQVVLDWLMTGDDVLRESARSASESTWSVSASASEAWSAASARSASRSASAAKSATWSATWSAARSASAAESAAKSATWSVSAAWSASAAAARAEFNLLVREAFE